MFEFKMPGRVLVMEGGAGKLGKQFNRLGVSRVLVVTDEGVRKAGLLEPVVAGLERGDVCPAGIFDEVPSDPAVRTIEDCAAVAAELDADGMVSVGGGSCIDTAKAATILLCEGGDLLDFEWNEYVASTPPLPHITVPTTAGTGSEATHVAMVTDESKNRKLMFQGADLLPRLAVLDPAMTVSLPPAMTAATGMDALTHAIEAMHSIWHQPLTDGLGLQAIGLVAKSLERAFTDGADMDARADMLLAANMGGIAAANSYIGIVHAIAHPLGAMFKAHHGVATSVALPYAMEMNLGYEGIPAIYAKVADALGVSVPGDDDITASRRGIEWIRGLISGLGLPQRLRELGVGEESLERLIDEVMEDRAMLVTPGNPDRDQVAELVRRAY